MFDLCFHTNWNLEYLEFCKFLFLFAYNTQGWVTEEAMLGAAVGFFSAVLSALIATLSAVNLVDFFCMLAVFGVGAALSIVQLLSSVGSIVALKIGIIVLNIFALSYHMYNDIMDSDDIVG